MGPGVSLVQAGYGTIQRYRYRVHRPLSSSLRAGIVHSAATLLAHAARPHFVTHTLFNLEPLTLSRRHGRFCLFTTEARGIVMGRICMLRTVLESEALQQHKSFTRREWAACLGTNPFANREDRVWVVHKVLGVAHVRLVQLWVHLDFRDGHRDSLGHKPGLGHDARKYRGAHRKLRRRRRRRRQKREKRTHLWNYARGEKFQLGYCTTSLWCIRRGARCRHRQGREW